jgi:hypothetical protein
MSEERGISPVTGAKPPGRPKGSKNKVTLLKVMAEEAIRDKNLPRMLQVCELIIDQALEGDKDSQRLIWQSIMSKSGGPDDKAISNGPVQININGLQDPTKAVKVIDGEFEEVKNG